MTEKPPTPPDYNALAKRYLDLWQEQVAKIARDPNQLSGTAAAWTQMAAAMMQNVPQPQTAAAHGSSKPAPPAPSGASPTAAAHGSGGVDLADVLGRLDRIEKRLSALEAGAAKPVRKRSAPRKSPGPAPGPDGGNRG